MLLTFVRPDDKHNTRGRRSRERSRRSSRRVRRNRRRRSNANASAEYADGNNLR